MLLPLRLIKRYQAFRPFNEGEAWVMFKLAAWGEAAGWTILIAGIYARDYVVHGANWPVAVAGQIHGTLFLLYIGAVIALSPSLGWSFWRMVLAGACSVPPYGSLVYELISAHFRHRTRAQQFYHLVWLHSLQT